MGTVALLVLFFVLFLFCLEATAESRIALVIGNGAYGADPLSDPPNDAQLIYETLGSLDFEVMRYINLNQQDMKKVIREFGKRIKNQKDSVGLFYYSGHGMQVGNVNYMIPVGVTIEDESDVSIYGVGVDEVLARMRFAGNSMNFVVLDACRDNPFEKSYKSPAKGLSRMEAPKGTLIAFAAQPNKVAKQGPGKYSYFTEALAQEIVKPDISARDMLLNVRIAVNNKTAGKQVPVVEDQLLAKFYFKAAGPLPVVPKPPTEPPIGGDLTPPQEARENWLSQNYDAALESFNKVINNGSNPVAMRLAQKRLQWLRGYRGRIVFADDFEMDTLGNGARWTLQEPGRGTGTGMFSRVQEDGNFILEGKGHYHAVAKIKNGMINQNFEIQLRFRPLNPHKGGAHINIMMDDNEGRSTVGLYYQGNILSLWEDKHGQKTEVNQVQPFASQWYMLRIVAIEQRIQVFLDGRFVLDYISPRSRVFLKGFNLEPIGGAVRFDNVLIIRS